MRLISFNVRSVVTLLKCKLRNGLLGFLNNQSPDLFLASYAKIIKYSQKKNDKRLEKCKLVTPLLSAHVTICLPQPQCFLSQPSGKQNLLLNKPSCQHNKERSILVFPGDFYQKSSNKHICNTMSVNNINFPPSQVPFFFVYVHVEVFHTLKITQLF